jgi:hypothetical protein
LKERTLHAGDRRQETGDRRNRKSQAACHNPTVDCTPQCRAERLNTEHCDKDIAFAFGAKNKALPRGRALDNKYSEPKNATRYLTIAME